MQEQAKAANEIASSSESGKKVIMRDYELIRQHKELFQEFIYVEMREHAKQLEIYAKMFEEVS